MLFGNPNKFAFLLEIVPEWSVDDFVNGLLYIYVNGDQYPKNIRTTTLSTDLFYLFNNSPFLKPKINTKLYSLCTKDLFAKLCDITFPESIQDPNDFSYLIPLVELENEGYYFFIIASKEEIRIIIWQCKDKDQKKIIDEVKMKISEFDRIKQQVQNYYMKNVK